MTPLDCAMPCSERSACAQAKSDRDAHSLPTIDLPEIQIDVSRDAHHEEEQAAPDTQKAQTFPGVEGPSNSS